MRLTRFLTSRRILLRLAWSNAHVIKIIQGSVQVHHISIAISRYTFYIHGILQNSMIRVFFSDHHIIVVISPIVLFLATAIRD